MGGDADSELANAIEATLARKVLGHGAGAVTATLHSRSRLQEQEQEQGREEDRSLELKRGR